MEKQTIIIIAAVLLIVMGIFTYSAIEQRNEAYEYADSQYLKSMTIIHGYEEIVERSMVLEDEMMAELDMCISLLK